MASVTAAERALLNEVKADPAAYQRLQDKARWEGMTLFAVLAAWGDPRRWSK